MTAVREQFIVGCIPANLGGYHHIPVLLSIPVCPNVAQSSAPLYPSVAQSSAPSVSPAILPLSGSYCPCTPHLLWPDHPPTFTTAKLTSWFSKQKYCPTNDFCESIVECWPQWSTHLQGTLIGHQRAKHNPPTPPPKAIPTTQWGGKPRNSICHNIDQFCYVSCSWCDKSDFFTSLSFLGF